MKDAFEKLVHLNHHLGTECAWCKQQTIESFSKHILEEAKEVELAIQQNDADELREELGDLLYNIIFLTRIAEKDSLFTMKDILDGAHQKICGRHKHVFEEKTDNLDRIWELYHEVKAKEKEEKLKRVKRPIFPNTTP